MPDIFSAKAKIISQTALVIAVEDVKKASDNLAKATTKKAILQAQNALSEAQARRDSLHAIQTVANVNNRALSDSYDIVQLAAVTLWEHIGKTLDEGLYTIP